MHRIKRKLPMISLLTGAILATGGLFSVANADQAAGDQAIPSWQFGSNEPTDSPLHDPMIMYNAGGLDGRVAVIGIPSFKTYRHIAIGVDLHEVSYGGTNHGNKNGTPDGKYLYVNDKGANTIGEINLQTGFLERLIALPFPFGLHHIALSTDGKHMFGTGEYTGKMMKMEIKTGKTQIIDWGPAPSAPDYIDAGRKGKYVFAGNYYHSTIGVFSANPFKFIKAIPVGKNPHGVDVIPEGTLAMVADKLSATMTFIDTVNLKVKKVIPSCAGPLHNVMDVYDKDGGVYEPGKDSTDGLTSKYGYQSCFVADSNVKVDIHKQIVVDEIPTHYRTGHISISNDNAYVFALNKFSTGLFSPTGIVYPVNFEMWDAREDSPTYGKTLKIMPVDGEPHNAKNIWAYQIKRWNLGNATSGGLLTKNLHQLNPGYKIKSKHYLAPKSTKRPGVTDVNGVKEVQVKAFSYGYVPRQIRVNKGDKVRIVMTNIDRAAGITKNPDITMGLTIYGPYGFRTNLSSPRGVSAVTEFTADIAGEYEIFCQHFCGPLHLEMRATFYVDDPEKGDSNLGVGDYAEAQQLEGVLQEGELTVAERVQSL